MQTGYLQPDEVSQQKEALVAKKKVGLARPKRTYVVIDTPMVHPDEVPKDYRLTEKRQVKDDNSSSGAMIEVNAEIGALAQASVKAAGKKLLKVRTERVRTQMQSGRHLNARRTTGWIFRRTFIFE